MGSTGGERQFTHNSKLINKKFYNLSYSFLFTYPLLGQSSCVRSIHFRNLN